MWTRRCMRNSPTRESTALPKRPADFTSPCACVAVRSAYRTCIITFLQSCDRDSRTRNLFFFSAHRVFLFFSCYRDYLLKYRIIQYICVFSCVLSRDAEWLSERRSVLFCSPNSRRVYKILSWTWRPFWKFWLLYIGHCANVRWLLKD